MYIYPSLFRSHLWSNMQPSKWDVETLKHWRESFQESRRHLISSKLFEMNNIYIFLDLGFFKWGKGSHFYNIKHKSSHMSLFRSVSFSLFAFSIPHTLEFWGANEKSQRLNIGPVCIMWQTLYSYLLKSTNHCGHSSTKHHCVQLHTPAHWEEVTVAKKCESGFNNLSWPNSFLWGCQITSAKVHSVSVSLLVSLQSNKLTWLIARTCVVIILLGCDNVQTIKYSVRRKLSVTTLSEMSGIYWWLFAIS